ncbi:TPA: hypothetical protein P8A87_000350 [Escherichia coli]|nr:hypothetical protein [Escherichia coli]HDQ3752958.1 hypothetical protein [Escherichia coli]
MPIHLEGVSRFDSSGVEWCGGNIRSQRSAWWDEIAWQDLRDFIAPKMGEWSDLVVQHK